MSTKKKGTTNVVLTSVFKKRAAASEEKAISFTFVNSFGISLSMLMTLASRMLDEKAFILIKFCLTAGVTIRGNLSFAKGVTQELKRIYPELIIEGDRDTGDVYNYGALHALGHIFAHISDHDFARKIIQKAGSCITNDHASTSEAGAINSEVYKSWTQEDKDDFKIWLSNIDASVKMAINGVINAMLVEATEFSKIAV